MVGASGGSRTVLPSVGGACVLQFTTFLTFPNHFNCRGTVQTEFATSGLGSARESKHCWKETGSGGIRPEYGKKFRSKGQELFIGSELLRPR